MLSSRRRRARSRARAVHPGKDKVLDWITGAVILSAALYFGGHIVASLLLR